MIKATEQDHVAVWAKHVGGRPYDVPSATSNVVSLVEIINPTTLTATCTGVHGSHAEAPPGHHLAQAIGAAVERVSRQPKPAPQPSPRTRPALPGAAAELDAKVRRLFPDAACGHGDAGRGRDGQGAAAKSVEGSAEASWPSRA